ncbi:MAG: ribosome silencing factor [Dehalococcoidia bacterium]|nr:ribosome silencing factor [Dehalococcoidia bacterium]MXY21617.1 ribosome silencing factor [Dehalococcoidia bacterium]
MIEQALIESRNWAEVAFDAADDMQASNIVLLDVQEACEFADYFVILTADSSRQLRALVEDIEEQMSAVGAHLHHVEGTHNSGWILMDYGGVIVHMMGPDERDYYGLENVWPEARRIRIIP